MSYCESNWSILTLIFQANKTQLSANKPRVNFRNICISIYVTVTVKSLIVWANSMSIVAGNRD